jgi:hypothetical protein
VGSSKKGKRKRKFFIRIYFIGSLRRLNLRAQMVLKAEMMYEKENLVI